MHWGVACITARADVCAIQGTEPGTAVSGILVHTFMPYHSFRCGQKVINCIPYGILLLGLFKR